jgi:hypothetical protein
VVLTCTVLCKVETCQQTKIDFELKDFTLKNVSIRLEQYKYYTKKKQSNAWHPVKGLGQVRRMTDKQSWRDAE